MNKVIIVFFTVLISLTTGFISFFVFENHSIISNLPSIQSISAGVYHSIALTSNGRVYTWGDNNNGQLGLGHTSDRTIPTLISFNSLQNGESIQSISAGVYHSIALTTNGRVYTWGANSYGQLGLGHTSDRTIPTLISFNSLQNGESIQSISAGYYYTIALTTNGRVYTWGANSYGQLGLGHTSKETIPTLISFNSLQNGESIQSISAGYYHTIALTTNRRVYTWGANWYGQLGLGHTSDRTIPTLISLISFNSLQNGESIQSISAGVYHSIALTSNGRVYTWGDNNNGQLGLGHTSDRTIPTLISFNSLQNGESIQSISAGYYHTIALTTNGRVYTWGDNYDGQLGLGHTSDRTIPTLISFNSLQNGESIQSISAGANHSIALTTNGRVYTWGENGDGQLGDGTLKRKITPSLIIV